MRLDTFASMGHYADHLRPVHDALPRSIRGGFLTEPVDAEPGHAVLVASYGDLRRARKMGYTRFAYMEHGAGQSYAGEPSTARRTGYAGGVDMDDVGLFLMPGEFPAGRWRSAYPKATVAVVGSPKVDALPRLDPSVPRGTVALGFHWAAGVTAETRTAFAWYRPFLHDLAQRFRVIGHGHPRGVDNEPHWPRAYNRMRIEWVPDFREVCRRAEVYVCDNSSTMYEFAATGRNVVVLNAPFYRKAVKHGGRFWDWATVGPQVDDPKRLPEAVAFALTADETAERERIVDLVYGRRGDAATRAVAAITDWIG